MLDQRENIKCLQKAAKDLDLNPEIIDSKGNYLVITVNGKPYHFIYVHTPFNNGAIDRMCKDKGYTYDFLKREISLPKTKIYLDPKCAPEFRHKLKYRTRREILDDVKSNFNFPVIVKMNRGNAGRNVYLCQNNKEVNQALGHIFNKKSLSYDYIALVQEYLSIDREFRVIRFRNKTYLIYEKVCANKTENLSPLHNDGAKALLISENDKIFQELDGFCNQINSLKDIEYCGIDIALVGHEFKIIELNTFPGFDIFISHVGPEPIIKMYKEILTQLKNEN